MSSCVGLLLIVAAVKLWRMARDQSQGPPCG